MHTASVRVEGWLEDRRQTYHSGVSNEPAETSPRPELHNRHALASVVTHPVVGGLFAALFLGAAAFYGTLKIAMAAVTSVRGRGF
jgi:hypothetical protein